MINLESPIEGIIDVIIGYHKTQCSMMFIRSGVGFAVNEAMCSKAEAATEILKTIIAALPDRYQKDITNKLASKIAIMRQEIFFSKDMAICQPTNGNMEE